MAITTRRIGVVLFQLGGPDKLEAIEPFLYNLFSDPDIIDFPFARIGRKPLAKLISATRAKKVEHHYSQLGGASPIRRFTAQQAWSLESELRKRGLDAHCFVAMRYWHPFTREAIAQVREAHCQELVLLPLYPHYSSTTTGSSLNEWNRLFHDALPVHRIACFYQNRTYLASLVEKIDEALQRFPGSHGVELVFSAHSLPMSVVDRGDPYQQQIAETVELVMAKGGWPNRYRLCYQSKVGASRWLQPSLHSTLRQLGEKRVKSVCIVPISFVSDHVETLGEIDHEARGEARRLGIEQFEMTSGLNDSATFIRALAELVISALSGPARTECAADCLVSSD